MILRFKPMIIFQNNSKIHFFEILKVIYDLKKILKTINQRITLQNKNSYLTQNLEIEIMTCIKRFLKNLQIM